MASTRNAVDSLAAHLAGSYPPTAMERWGAVAKAILFAMMGPAIVYLVWVDDPEGFRDGWWFMALLVGGSLFLALAVIFQETATWTVDGTSFSRRNIVPAGSWSVHVSDIQAIDYDVRTDSLELFTAGDRKRKFVLRKAALENLRVPEPEVEPQGVDVASQRRGLLWYSSVATVLGIVVLVVDTATWNRQVAPIASFLLRIAVPIAVAAILFGPAGIVWSLMLRGAARDPGAPRRYRLILYVVLALVVIGVTALILVLSRKGLAW